MAEEPYSKREIDAHHGGIHTKLDRLIKLIEYTNGKVKRLTIALVAVGFFALGLGVVEAEKFLSIIIW